MSNIRVTYSGLISFMIGLLSIITGLVFTIIVTRQLSPEQLGSWTLIGGLIVYVMVIEPMISYWATRETARDIKSGKTALVSSTIFSTIAITIYLIIALVVSENSQVSRETLFFAAILIPVTFTNRILSAINYGWKPHVERYGFLAAEISKIPAGVLFVYFLQMGVEGAIVATFIGNIISISVLIVFGRRKLKGSFSFDFVKKWFKLSWISLYPGITGVIIKLDVLIFSILTGAVTGLAYYTAAFAVSSLVIHSGAISKAIYPKLLGDARKEHLEENLMRLFYFSIPLTAISIAFMKGGLFALNPAYEIAVIVVFFLSLRAFTSTLTVVFTQSLSGIEKVDMDEKSTFKDYFKSKLFFVPTVKMIKAGLYIISLVIIFVIFNDSTQIQLVEYWAMTALLIEIPFTIYFYLVLRRYFEIQIERFTILKYVIISVGVFGSTFLLAENYLEYNAEIFKFLPNLLIFVFIGILGYLGLTYVIDVKTRKLFKSIFNEICKKN